METAAIDFVPWGLDATWPSRRWLEPVDGRRDGPPRGVRLGHASDSALVLVCTYPRARFDAEMPGTGADLVRELAFETTFALINFALHQVKVPGRRPEGFVGSLVSYANQQADRYLDWGTTHWGIEPEALPGQDAWQGREPRQGQEPRQGREPWQGQDAWQAQDAWQRQEPWPGQDAWQGQEPWPGQDAWQGQEPWPGQEAWPGRHTQAAATGQAGPSAWREPAGRDAGALRASGAVARTIGLGSWRSGFSLANPDAYIVVHACGISLDHLLLRPITDPLAYGLAAEPPLLGEMHWELWPNHQELGYDDLALLVGAR